METRFTYSHCIYSSFSLRTRYFICLLVCNAFDWKEDCIVRKERCDYELLDHRPSDTRFAISLCFYLLLTISASFPLYPLVAAVSTCNIHTARILKYLLQYIFFVFTNLASRDRIIVEETNILTLSS